MDGINNLGTLEGPTAYTIMTMYHTYSHTQDLHSMVFQGSGMVPAGGFQASSRRSIPANLELDSQRSYGMTMDSGDDMYNTHTHTRIHPPLRLLASRAPASQARSRADVTMLVLSLLAQMSIILFSRSCA